MGCDIHTAIERRNHKTGAWELVKGEEPFGDSNYGLFSILAGVRDYAGTAEPLVRSRGFPDDISSEAQKWAWDEDGHNFNYLTLRELLEADWTKTLTRTGLVDPMEFSRWKHYGEPQAWCQGTSARIISNEEMSELVKDLYPHQVESNLVGFVSSSVFTQIAWGEPYYRIGMSFIAECIFGKMLPLRDKRYDDLDDIRLLFFFDN